MRCGGLGRISEAKRHIRAIHARYADVAEVEADALQVCRTGEVELVSKVAVPGRDFPLSSRAAVHGEARVEQRVAGLRDAIFVHQLKVLLRRVAAVAMQRYGR